jgi:predicted RecA/RadA family phage recombinase
VRNEVFQERASNARFFACPASIVGGDIVLIGDSMLPAVALESYNATRGGATFRMSGTFELTVIAATVISPPTGSEIKEGDTIYATGTLDATTGVTYGLTLSKATGGSKVGTYDSPTPQTSGSTSTTARVRLREVGI